MFGRSTIALISSQTSVPSSPSPVCFDTVCKCPARLFQRGEKMMSTAIAPKKPEIKTELPGPKGRAIIEADAQFVTPSYPRPAFKLVADHGKGVWVTDVDGNVFLDCNAGVAVCSTGHCHPEVVRAIQDQAAGLIHMCGTDYFYRQM